MLKENQGQKQRIHVVGKCMLLLCACDTDFCQFINLSYNSENQLKALESTSTIFT